MSDGFATGFDPSEVYDVSVDAGISVGVESGCFGFDLEHTDGAEVFVDEVWKATVALVAQHSGGGSGAVEYEQLVSLDPEAARTLGETLLRAAAMAETQRGEES